MPISQKNIFLDREIMIHYIEEYVATPSGFFRLPNPGFPVCEIEYFPPFIQKF